MRLRARQAEADGLTKVTRVTQRDLDMQDGRVLHRVRGVGDATKPAEQKPTPPVPA